MRNISEQLFFTTPEIGMLHNGILTFYDFCVCGVMVDGAGSSLLIC